MAKKCRLYLEKIHERAWSDTTILCKHIHTIVIDGKTYFKNDCGGDTVAIQNLYRIITKNIDSITYIRYGTFVGDKFTENESKIYLKNRKLHNFAGPAIENDYYINGKQLSYEDWRTDKERNRWLREHKLGRILDE